MAHLIDKDALVAEIENLLDKGKYYDDYDRAFRDGNNSALYALKERLDTLEAKEVDLEEELKHYCNDYYNCDYPKQLEEENCSEAMPHIVSAAKHFFELGLKVQHDNWKVVDNTNPPQADRNKIYCVLSKNKYLLARVVNHPHDELLQWKCTEFPFHRYDMCEGDKYMQIV